MYTLYEIFVYLDADETGTLNVDEVMDFPGTQICKAQFTRRGSMAILEANRRNTGLDELDYLGFINLALVIENRSSPSAVNFFWRVLDIEDKGLLTPQAITYFFEDICEGLPQVGYHSLPPTIDIVINEIHDLLGNNDPEGISYDDFKNSKHGGLVASMLLDPNHFISYENRES